MELELDLRLDRFGCAEMKADSAGTENNCFKSVIDHEQSRAYFCREIFVEYLLPERPQNNASFKHSKR